MAKRKSRKSRRPTRRTRRSTSRRSTTRRSRRPSRRSTRRSTTRRSKHAGAKYAVKCGKSTRSWHRLKRAATKARKAGCRVVKVR